jgi:hypothetical protein
MSGNITCALAYVMISNDDREIWIDDGDIISVYFLYSQISILCI